MPALALPRVRGAMFRTHDAVHGGEHRVFGTVVIDDSPDIPVQRRVRLFIKQNAQMIREVWSDPVTGAYAFNHVKNQQYFVIAHDYLNVYDAVAHDNITPEPMP